ncbi:TfuA-like protein [Micromonosporaceae bacterium Da 78-11]
MTGPKIIVYAGPTISVDDVHALLPQAEVRAPAGRGDLLAQAWQPGDIAVLIDGYFRERRSVGHKEILWLLSEGVRVIGAASMGALRAAELSPYGMRGIGEVHRMYASGEIDGDDEVGMLHGPASMGYPPMTVALVNLRYGCREGAGTELVPAAAGQRIVDAAKALPFTSRSWPDLERAVGEDYRDALESIRGMIDSGVWDVKRLDAMAALQVAGGLGAAVAGPALTEVTWTGISHGQLTARRSMREYAPGRWMSDLDVLDAARLFDEEYPARHEQVLTGLLADLACDAGLTLAAYANRQLGVEDGTPLPAGLASWVAGSDPRSAYLVMVRLWPIWQSVDWRPAMVADLRASGRWDEWCDLVARADEATEATRYRRAVPPPAICAQLFLRHWRPRDTSEQIELARRGFSARDELGATVRRFFALDVGPGARQ